MKPNTPTTDVHLRELGLRDGLQMNQPFVPTADKLAWIAAEYTDRPRE